MKAFKIPMFPNNSSFPRSIPISFQLNGLQFRLNCRGCLYCPKTTYRHKAEQLRFVIGLRQICGCLKILVTQLCVWNVVIYYWCVRRPQHFRLLNFRTYSWYPALRKRYAMILCEGVVEWRPEVMALTTTPIKTTPNRNKGFARTYEGKPIVTKSLLRPYFLGSRFGG